MTIWRMRIACWIPKVTNTHTQNDEYLLLFHYQEWLHEGTSVLRYTYTDCIALFSCGKAETSNT